MRLAERKGEALLYRSEQDFLFSILYIDEWEEDATFNYYMSPTSLRGASCCDFSTVAAKKRGHRDTAVSESRPSKLTAGPMWCVDRIFLPFKGLDPILRIHYYHLSGAHTMPPASDVVMPAEYLGQLHPAA